MNKTDVSEITKLLRDWNEGDENAIEKLLPVVYNELKSQARYLMSSERSNHTLQPTALVHEAFIKISQQSDFEFQNRKHFYRIVSRLMRQILVDHARKRATAKRGNNPINISLDDLQVPIEDPMSTIIAVDNVLKELAEFDERQAKIVEMRFFGGLSNSEIAEAFDITERTVGREWRAARLWLLREVDR